jgi:diguanylate cyclase (GGDEF)-like protein/PAS domain S-box-containing protein
MIRAVDPRAIIAGSIGTVAVAGASALFSGATGVARIMSVTAGILLIVSCARVGRTAGVPPDSQAFWRRLAIVVGLVSTGILIGWSGHRLAVLAALAIDNAALLMLLWGLVSLPLDPRTRSEWVTSVLDAGTVVVCVGLFGWHFLVFPALEQPGGTNISGLISAIVHGLVATVAGVRVCLDWNQPEKRRSLTLLGCGLLVLLTAELSHALDFGRDTTTPALTAPFVAATIPLACTLWVWAATERNREAGPTSTSPFRPHRRFSLLPAVAVIATGSLLYAAGSDAPPQGRIVVIGSLCVAALAMLRQMVTLYDNDRLLQRVDAGKLDLYRHEQRFQALMRNSSDIVLVTAEDGTIKYASPSLQEILGVSLESLIGRSLAESVHPDDRIVAATAKQEFMAAPDATVTYHLRALRPDGTWRWVELVSRNMLHDRSVQGVLTNARDVTDARRFQDRLAYQGSHDELTGLANRAEFLARAAAALAAPDGTAMTSVAVIDIDGFRTINDRLGHGVGDDILISVGHALTRRLDPGSTLARLGDDEYAVLMIATSAETELAAVSLLEAVNEPLDVLGHNLLLQLSAGLAHGDVGLSATEMVRRAEVALSAAKELGQGRHVTYATEHDRELVEYATIGAELRTALNEGHQLHLLYQPIVSLPEGRLRAVEALVRWWHPEHGVMSPDDFVPVAERNGLIIPMGKWIMRTACRQAARWAEAAPQRPVAISVNVSARQLREPGFADDLVDVLLETGLDPSLLTVEVTETAVFDNERALQTLKRINRLGVGIALDDFGTGHSSLGLLRTCPVDIIKVDKTFVDDITGPPEKTAIAASLLHIARAMNLIAVAEGVETTEQATALEQLGYRYAQGFLFARPMPAEQITELLLHNPERPVVPEEAVTAALRP